AFPILAGARIPEPHCCSVRVPLSHSTAAPRQPFGILRLDYSAFGRIPYNARAPAACAYGCPTQPTDPQCGASGAPPLSSPSDPNPIAAPSAALRLAPPCPRPAEGRARSKCRSLAFDCRSDETLLVKRGRILDSSQPGNDPMGGSRGRRTCPADAGAGRGGRPGKRPRAKALREARRELPFPRGSSVGTRAPGASFGPYGFSTLPSGCGQKGRNGRTGSWRAPGSDRAGPLLLELAAEPPHRGRRGAERPRARALDDRGPVFGCARRRARRGDRYPHAGDSRARRARVRSAYHRAERGFRVDTARTFPVVRGRRR